MPTDPHKLHDQENIRAQAWLVGGGEMGKLIRAMDWTNTPLGSIDSWPQSLRTTVSLCLASNFPISLAWGPNHVQIYNDGYWPICGGKHPHSMGQDFSECWASAWPAIGEAFARALAGETSYLENQRMFLDRHGYLEETFFTFSFSPIRDETGGVGGLFHPVTETTGKMLSERRTRSLRDLAARTGKARSIEEAFILAAETLADFDLDLPFSLFYVLDDAGKTARLTAHTGLRPGTIASPERVNLESLQSWEWPLAEVAHSGQAQQLEDLEQRFGPLTCGPYPESPQVALMLPITPPGCERPLGIFIAGVSTRLPLNEVYRTFCELLAAGTTTAVANARAYEEERKRAEALAEIDRAKTAFFSNVSHEFRTPLTLMLGPLEDELAEQQNPLPPARRERLETAHRNSLRLLKLVNTLLDFSRIEAGRTQARYEPTDLAAYTTELASVFRAAVEKAGLSLTVDCPPLPEPLYVDREMWEKIVLNLLSNAFKHTFAGGITVRLRWRGEYAELAIADTGVGIPAEELPRLFERFHRVKGSRSRTHEGTGIGLALVQELAGLHGGKVSVESQEGRGSTFTVTVKAGHHHLPADQVREPRQPGLIARQAMAYVEEALHWLPAAPASADALPPTGAGDNHIASAEPSAVPGDPQARILLADDNADLRAYVTGLLASRYRVEAVADGEQALQAARESKPDLILSDVMMPRLDGFGLLRELRADIHLQTIPVILLSARAGEESAVEGLEAGADDYLVKPFAARELLARVRTHLRMTRLRQAWAQELERANKELESFAYSVSHDLKAPLRAIEGFSRILLEDYRSVLDVEGDRLLNVICGNTLRMSQLIDNLLEFSRLGRQVMAHSVVSLEDLAKSAFDEVRAANPRRRLRLHIQKLPRAYGDRAMLRQAMINLLSNAVKFTRTQKIGQIEIGSRVENTQTVYYVRDNGSGFDMQYADKLFGVFQRLHSEKEYEGTGIGLSLVQRIIERHGGRIWAAGEVGTGATFYFTLPDPKEGS